ncbi:MAG TPA: hypothetical protein VM734_03465 [Kofleriaceae bacterium]|jgi:hypothetical protein|nr:hypothetical protein [Kofleriaceae bacterium]
MPTDDVPPAPPPKKRRFDRLRRAVALHPEQFMPGFYEDLFATVLLSTAALGTAYGAWQAGLWDGHQAAHYTRTNAEHAEAAQISSLAAAELSYDGISTLELALAWVEKGPAKVDLLARHVIRREFRPYLEAWLETRPFVNPSAPSTPFAMPGFYNARLAAAQAHSHAAEHQYEAGQQANEISDNYLLSTVIFGFVLFFAGISPKLHRRPFRWAALIVSAIAMILALVLLIQLPRA